MHLLKDREMRRACISLLIFNMDMMLVNIPFHFLHFDGGHILSGFSFTCFLKKIVRFWNNKTFFPLANEQQTHFR